MSTTRFIAPGSANSHRSRSPSRPCRTQCWWSQCAAGLARQGWELAGEARPRIGQMIRELRKRGSEGFGQPEGCAAACRPDRLSCAMDTRNAMCRHRAGSPAPCCAISINLRGGLMENRFRRNRAASAGTRRRRGGNLQPIIDQIDADDRPGPGKAGGRRLIDFARVVKLKKDRDLPVSNPAFTWCSVGRPVRERPHIARHVGSLLYELSFCCARTSWWEVGIARNWLEAPIGEDSQNRAGQDGRGPRRGSCSSTRPIRWPVGAGAPRAHRPYDQEAIRSN